MVLVCGQPFQLGVPDRLVRGDDPLPGQHVPLDLGHGILGLLPGLRGRFAVQPYAPLEEEDQRQGLEITEARGRIGGHVGGGALEEPRQGEHGIAGYELLRAGPDDPPLGRGPLVAGGDNAERQLGGNDPLEGAAQLRAVLGALQQGQHVRAHRGRETVRP